MWGIQSQCTILQSVRDGGLTLLLQNVETLRQGEVENSNQLSLHILIVGYEARKLLAVSQVRLGA